MSEFVSYFSSVLEKDITFRYPFRVPTLDKDQSWWWISCRIVY